MGFFKREGQAPAADSSWKAGYDSLYKQMAAIQSTIDVYKGPSPLSAERHMENIAASLARDYGVNSINDIGIRQVPITNTLERFGFVGPSRLEGYYDPETGKYYDKNDPGLREQLLAERREWGDTEFGGPLENRLVATKSEFFSKSDPNKIIPARKFASEGSGDGYSEYNLQAVPDGRGGMIAVPTQIYSKSGWGEVAQDIAPLIPIANAIALAAGAPPILVASANVGFQYGAGNINDLGDAVRVAAPIMAADPGVVGAAAKVYTAYQAFDKGDVLSGLSTVASVLGMGGLANDLRFAAALKNNDVPGMLISLGNMSGVSNYEFKDENGKPILGTDGKPVTLSTFKVGGENGFTLLELGKSAAIAANLLSDKPNYGLALQMAGELRNSPDTAMAGKALSLFETLSNPNASPTAIYQSAMSFAGGVNSRVPGSVPIDNKSANEAINAGNLDPAIKIANDNDVLLTDLGAGKTTTLTPEQNKLLTTGNNNDVLISDLGVGTTTPITGGTTTTTGGTTTPTYNSPFSVKIGDKEYDLDNMGGASTKNADGTITKLNATQFAALGEPAITVSDLYNMDAYLGATGEYIYKDSSGTSYFVDDDGNVQSLTKQQADSLVLPDTKKYTGTLDPVTIVGDRYKESLGYDWFPNLKTTTTTSGINTITTDSIKALPTDSIKALPTDSIKALPTDNIKVLPTDNIKALPTDNIKALPTDNIKALPTDNIGTIGSVNTTNIGTLTTTNTGTLTSDQISALTTTPARGLQALPTSDARYWRQTGATGTGGKGGVRFFDWYDTPENRTMAPPALTSQQIATLTSQQIATLTSQQVSILKGGGKVEDLSSNKMVQHFADGGSAWAVDSQGRLVSPDWQKYGDANLTYSFDPSLFKDRYGEVRSSDDFAEQLQGLGDLPPNQRKAAVNQYMYHVTGNIGYLDKKNAGYEYGPTIFGTNPWTEPTVNPGISTDTIKNLKTLPATNTTSSTTKTTTPATTASPALTTTPALGLQTLPTSNVNTIFTTTQAPATTTNTGTLTTSQISALTTTAPVTTTAPAATMASTTAITPPAAKQYFNAATNRYYTDPTGTWQPPAGWAQTGLKGGGEVKTNFYDGGYADFDSPIELRGIEHGGGSMSDEDVYSYLRSLPSDNSWTGSNFDTSGLDFGNLDSAIGSDFTGGNNYLGYEDGVMSEDDVEAYLRSLPSENASYGDPEDPRNENYGNEGRAYSGKNAIDPVTGSPINAKVGSPTRSLKPNPLKGLADAAKRNPDLMKMLLAAGLGGLIGYAGRPKGFNPKGMQGLGLSQGQVYGALKGVPVKRAMGGEIDGYAGGGGLHYLKSAEDGMADKIPATIDNKQPAKLSGGEFVIPADVVSHLGNGNSEAGAKQLYAMMDRIRHARTGTKEQGKQINPAKFTPK